MTRPTITLTSDIDDYASMAIYEVPGGIGIRVDEDEDDHGSFNSLHLNLAACAHLSKILAYFAQHGKLPDNPEQLEATDGGN